MGTGADGEGSVPGSEVSRAAQRGLLLAAVASISLGAVVLFVFLAFLFPGGPEDVESLIVVNAVVLAVFLPLTLTLGAAWARRSFDPVDRWLTSERAAGGSERAAALRQAVQQVRITAVFWAIGTGLFTAINAPTLGWSVVLLTVTLVLGGLTTCALLYLLAERVLRPVTARALAGGTPAAPTAPGVTARLTMSWTLATGVPVLGVAAMAVAELAGEDAAAGAILFLAALAMVVGLLAMVFAARSVADPVARVRAALARVEEGDFSAQVPVDDASEVGLLEAGFNRMAAGLAERERMRDLFGRHVGTEVAHAALEREVALGGEEREVAALFVDLVGSTRLAVERSPQEGVAALNGFFRIVIEVVERHGGSINKLEGDAALCVFGAPVARTDFAGDALAAARELRDRLDRELAGMDAGIGVAAGVAVAGNVGAERRFEYTVIGDPVNEAARLCELAKRRPERVLASETTVIRADGAEGERWRLEDAVVLRGRAAETRLATLAA